MPAVCWGFRRPIIISSDELEVSQVKCVHSTHRRKGLVACVLMWSVITRILNDSYNFKPPNMEHSRSQQDPLTINKSSGFPVPTLRMPVPEPYIHKPPQEHDSNEHIAVPDFDADPYSADMLTPAQAESTLRDLMASDSNTNQTTEINPEDAIVPHQILGRAWMHDREDVTKKCAGGILADDTG